MELIKGLFVIALFLLNLWLYTVNIVNLASCDFKAPFKGEIVHAVGIFTPTYLITGWKNWDK